MAERINKTEGKDNAERRGKPFLGAGRRLTLLCLCGAMLIAAAGLYVAYRLYLPEGEGPAGPSVASEPFHETWTERQVLLLGVGDSVTAGFGVRHDLGYFRRLATNPPDEFEDMRGKCLSCVLPNLDALNIAVSGSNSISHVDHVKERIPRQPEDVFGLVVISTGGNDLIHWYGRTPPKEGAMYGAALEQAEPWIANYKERLAAILDGITEAFPGGCLIFIADIYDPSDGVGDAPFMGLPSWDDGVEILGRYNAVIRDAAAKRDNVVLVPMHATFLGHGFHCTNWWNTNYRSDDPHYWYGSNLEDPNERGYDALRRVFLNEIVAVRDRISAESK